jgi:hypothetical protein
LNKIIYGQGLATNAWATARTMFREQDRTGNEVTSAFFKMLKRNL